VGCKTFDGLIVAELTGTFDIAEAVFSFRYFCMQLSLRTYLIYNS
jgi:hypothetical protein